MGEVLLTDNGREYCGKTSGVVVRFNRTLKDQVTYRHVFRNVQEAREAFATFVERDNQHWLLEKTPLPEPHAGPARLACPKG